MPANSADYQQQYRKQNAHRTKNVTVSLPISQHSEFAKYAKVQELSLSALMREATDLQIRNSSLKSRAILEELQELRFLVSNIANNINQMARHSNRLKAVVDENDVFKRLKELDDMIVRSVETRLTTPL